MTKTCTAEGCTQPHKSRGLCSAHYQRWLKANPNPPGRSVEDRFWAKVDKTGDCWIWTAHRVSNGYGGFFVSPERRVETAHRYSYELANGPIPDGLSVCHRCDNPPCVNPAHLFLGTVQDNALDMTTKGRHGTKGISAKRGTCKRGHPWIPENIASFNSGGKPRTRCRVCQRSYK